MSEFLFNVFFVHGPLSATDHYCWHISLLDRCCNTTEEHKPRDLEVVGLNPAGWWIYFFFFSFPSFPTFLHRGVF